MNDKVDKQLEMPQELLAQLNNFSNSQLEVLIGLMKNQIFINVYAYLKTQTQVPAVNVLEWLIIFFQSLKKKQKANDPLTNKQPLEEWKEEVDKNILPSKEEVDTLVESIMNPKKS